MADHPVVTALFPDRDSAERAYRHVLDRGYESRDVDVVMSDETRRRHFGESGGIAAGGDDGGASGRTTELGNKAAEGAGVGSAIGGTVGAVAASLAAVGTSVALPGIGLVIAGPIAAALAGAGAGGAAGGLVGALVGWNIPEERVKAYESGLQQGGILMGVRPRSSDDARELEARWREVDAQSLQR